ncbi:Uncharacterised protein [Mycobacterium tuberculosis]|uniref:Uncharacterized protein n=1 Tax=Mycobacterium tuberculosis TaxID=1773 RepID=A0A655ARJ8_MYCTX|nr:Uncharacterised protein [Mycobacterium tuberculosis]CKT47048.1 Uncharacterised protein [Mycobacterium tuberculosis]CKU31261.1 Uncharacterised protein [Mycobacterium tuberculosis]CKV21507.1 Uncharacterised protein [Mycobacterium tuberculosis]
MQIGSPNAMRHFEGNGTSPTGPANGNNGVIGKYGRPNSRASSLTSVSMG